MQLLVAALLVSATLASAAFDVVSVLSAFPEYSAFTQALQSTGVAAEINAQNSVSLLVVPNLPGGFTLEEVADILRFHTVLQAVDNDFLTHLPGGTQVFTTLYQRTGRAGEQGSVNITNQPDGTTGVGLVGAPAPSATVVKNVTRVAYEISVFEITNAIVPNGLAEAAITNVTESLAAGGQYATLLTLLQSNGLVKAVQDLASTGLTLFAPTDSAFNNIKNTLNTLTPAQQTLVLTYHVVPQYINGGQLLASNQVINTAAGYTFVLTNVNGKPVIQTGIVNSTEQATIADKSPAAIYAVDTVLIPPALFAPAPAPAPELSPVLSPVLAPEAPLSPLLAPLAPLAPLSPLAPLAPLAPEAPLSPLLAPLAPEAPELSPTLAPLAPEAPEVSPVLAPLAPLAPEAPEVSPVLAPTPVVAPLAPLAPSAPTPAPRASVVSPAPAKSPSTTPSSAPRASSPSGANNSTGTAGNSAGSVGVSLAVVSSVVVAASAFLF